jgi:crotonobetainyl-CoA:carnitine CoA-transferase CaiB-like acyl-CoA transferase
MASTIGFPPANAPDTATAMSPAFGDAPPAVGAAPLLGQHSGNILADWLKMDDAEIGQLRESKVIAGDVAAAAIVAE